MSESQKTLAPAVGFDLAMASAERGFACWSRAWTRLAHGAMDAGLARMDLARSMLAAAPDEWTWIAPTGEPAAESARRWRLRLDRAKARFDRAIDAYRVSNDALAAAFFAAAEALVDGMEAGQKHDGAASPFVASPNTRPVATPVERKAA